MSYDKEKQREYAKKHYSKNRDKAIKRANVRRDELRKKIIKYKSDHPCICGETHPAALDFHHTNKKKEFCISTAYSNCYSWHRIEAEILKCIVICRNCHAKLHCNLE